MKLYCDAPGCSWWVDSRLTPAQITAQRVGHAAEAHRPTPALMPDAPDRCTCGAVVGETTSVAVDRANRIVGCPACRMSGVAPADVAPFDPTIKAEPVDMVGASDPATLVARVDITGERLNFTADIRGITIRASFPRGSALTENEIDAIAEVLGRGAVAR